MPPAHKAYAAYRSAEVETLTQRDLIVKLYQGAERFLVQCQMGMRNGDLEQMTTGSTKAKRIFIELVSTLNMEAGGEIAANLRNLYLFLIAEITAAHVERDPARIDALMPVIATLREAWQGIPDGEANTSSLSQPQNGCTFSMRM